MTPHPDQHKDHAPAHLARGAQQLSQPLHHAGVLPIGLRAAAAVGEQAHAVVRRREQHSKDVMSTPMVSSQATQDRLPAKVLALDVRDEGIAGSTVAQFYGDCFCDLDGHRINVFWMS